MKKVIIFTILIINAALFAGDYDFTLSVQNQQVSGTDFIFDVYMLRTGDLDIYLGDSDFAFTFNSGNFSSPVASVVTAAPRIVDQYGYSASIVSTNRIVLNLTKPNFSDQAQFDARVQVVGTTGNGTLVGQVKISNISVPTGTAGLVWRTSGDNVTIVNRFDSTTPWAQHNIDAFATYTPPSDQSLPVELSTFTVENAKEGVLLQWVTESEKNNLGYIIERQPENETEWAMVASYKTDDELKGQGTSTSRHEYSYTDKDVRSGDTFTYRLSDMDRQGNKSVLRTSAITVTAKVPDVTALLRPYPNPFNPVTRISYDLSTDANVTIQVYNVKGQVAAELHNGKQAAGSYTIDWSAGHLPSGMYIIRMTTGSYTKTQKCLLLK